MAIIPQPPCRGQAITADLLRDVIAAIRATRPLKGDGILLQESPNGTLISAAAQKQSPVTPFDHRFKVSFAKNKDGGYDLAIRKGSLWRVTGGVAAEQTLTLGEGLAEHPNDTDAWQVAAATAGSLYVSQSAAEDGTTPVFTLDYAATPTAPAAVIADFTPSQSSSNPTPKLTQRLLGDLILFEGGGTGGEVPAAWMVRRHAFTETSSSGEEVTTHKWQVFSPLWAVGRETLLPDGMSRGWNDLPEDADSGTLYAALTWVGTATADANGNETVSWAPGKPILTNSLSDIPPDDDPVADDPGSSSIDGTPGHRSVIVEIGDFKSTDSEENSPDTEEGDSGDDTAPDSDFRQAHLGVIVENIAAGSGSGGGLPDGAELLSPVSVTEETDDSTSSGGRVTGYKISQSKVKWDAAEQAFVPVPDSTIELYTIPAVEGIPNGAEVWGKIEVEEVTVATYPEKYVSQYKIHQWVQRWDANQKKFVDNRKVSIATLPAPVNYVPGPPEYKDVGGIPYEQVYWHKVTLTSSGPTLTKTSKLAWQTQLAYHASDHVDGVV